MCSLMNRNRFSSKFHEVIEHYAFFDRYVANGNLIDSQKTIVICYDGERENRRIRTALKIT